MESIEVRVVVDVPLQISLNGLCKASCLRNQWETDVGLLAILQSDFDCLKVLSKELQSGLELLLSGELGKGLGCLVIFA